MKNIEKILILTGLCAGAAFAQKPHPKIAPKPAAKTGAKPAVKPAAKSKVDSGSLSGRTYTNQQFNFSVTFPDEWLVPDKDFESYMLKQGFDLRLKLPPAVTALQTAYKAMPGTPDNSILRITAEDLTLNPQIKDAVDYFDAMRQSFKKVKLPADFTYSETQAEKLGAMQFGYIETASAESGKKRMYATVRNGYALMFTLTYKDNADVEALRQILSDGDFALKK